MDIQTAIRDNGSISAATVIRALELHGGFRRLIKDVGVPSLESYPQVLAVDGDGSDAIDLLARADEVSHLAGPYNRVHLTEEDLPADDLNISDRPKAFMDLVLKFSPSALNILVLNLSSDDRQKLDELPTLFARVSVALDAPSCRSSAYRTTDPASPSEGTLTASDATESPRHTIQGAHHVHFPRPLHPHR